MQFGTRKGRRDKILAAMKEVGIVSESSPRLSLDGMLLTLLRRQAEGDRAADFVLACALLEGARDSGDASLVQAFERIVEIERLRYEQQQRERGQQRGA